MALLRLIVVVAFFLLGAWASQATAHTNHVNKATSNYVKISRAIYGNNVNNAPANPKPEKKFQNGPRNSNNGGIQYTQVANPTVYSLPDANTVETINNVVEKASETMAEPPPPSGTCDGNHRAFGGWLAVIIAVSLYHHHRL